MPSTQAMALEKASPSLVTQVRKVPCQRSAVLTGSYGSRRIPADTVVKRSTFLFFRSFFVSP